jgi:acyl carrier protein
VEIWFFLTASARSAVSTAACRSLSCRINKYDDKRSWIMDSKEVFEKVKSLIAEKLEIDEGKITMNASFRKDLGADSLDTYELVYAIEEELGVSIPDEKANEFETVKDAVDFLSAQL